MLSLWIIWPLPGTSMSFSALSDSVVNGINWKSVQLQLSEMRIYLSGIFFGGKQPCVPLSWWETIVRSYLPAFSSFSTFISSVIRAVNLWEKNTWIKTWDVEMLELIWWDLRRDQKIHSIHSVIQFTMLVQQFMFYLLFSLFFFFQQNEI